MPKKPKLVDKDCKDCTSKWKLLGLCSACATEVHTEDGKTMIWPKAVVEEEK